MSRFAAFFLAPMKQVKLIAIVLLQLLVFYIPNVEAIEIPTSVRSQKAIAKVESSLKSQLAAKNLRYGSPIFIRIFKEPARLELWVKSDEGVFKEFKQYPICNFSGDLGPKLRQGDRQSPEGFYFVKAGNLNPWSRFHLSFNIGYPNQYDRYHKRTGSALMVHGNCVSIGCYAMTDKYIDEIYALVDAALRNGQPFFRVHIFPFELSDDNLASYKQHKWYDFWKNLQQGYQYFIDYGVPPNVEVSEGRYRFE